ncbi:MAG: hypothetical protein ACK44Q_13415, partial [Pirellulaceae bacterium]
FFLASIQIGATHLSEDFQSPALAGLHDWDGHATGQISIASIQIGATHLSQYVPPTYLEISKGREGPAAGGLHDRDGHATARGTLARNPNTPTPSKRWQCGFSIFFLGVGDMMDRLHPDRE